METESVCKCFGKHPSKKLQEVFSQKPYQIQKPEKAKIIFLGLDANFDKDIEKDECFFNETLKYLKDGVEYWKSNKDFHTPMLNPKCNYKGDGIKYHRNFRKLYFTSKKEDDICFMELLKCCTYGSSGTNRKLFMEMVKAPENKEHLCRIKKLAEMGKKICISKSVSRIINQLKLFDVSGENIIIHRHLSWISNKELKALGKELHEFLAKSTTGGHYE